MPLAGRLAGVKRRQQILAILLAASLAWAGERPPDVIYLGKDAGAATGWVEVEQARYQVRPGTPIADWGHVREVTDDLLIVVRIHSELDKARARAKGAMAVDVTEAHIPRQALQLEAHARRRYRSDSAPQGDRRVVRPLVWDANHDGRWHARVRGQAGSVPVSALGRG